MAGDIRKIGFVGLGNMGADQVRELLKVPVPLTIYDVAPASMALFDGKATLAKNMAEVGTGADAVSICVQDDQQVNQCAELLLPAMKPGSVLMIHSTVRPATMIALGQRSAARGITVLDAAVTRTGPIKDGPFLFCMTGGDESAALRMQSILDAFSTNTLYVGPLGSAMALKICNNLASICSVLIGLEAVSLAETVGVPLEKLLTVMKQNGVLTPFAQYFVSAKNSPSDELKATMKTMAGICEKDLRLAETLASDAGAEAPITSFVRDKIREKITRLFEK